MNEFLTVEQDFTMSNAWNRHYESQHKRSLNGRQRANDKKWRAMSFGKFEPKAIWKRCFSGREEYAT